MNRYNSKRGGPSSASKWLRFASLLQLGVLRRARRGQWWPCRIMVRGNAALLRFDSPLNPASWNAETSHYENRGHSAKCSGLAPFFVASWAGFRFLSMRLPGKASLSGCCSNVCIVRAVKFFLKQKDWDLNCLFQSMSLFNFGTKISPLSSGFAWRTQGQTPGTCTEQGTSVSYPRGVLYQLQQANDLENDSCVFKGSIHRANSLASSCLSCASHSCMLHESAPLARKGAKRECATQACGDTYTALGYSLSKLNQCVVGNEGLAAQRQIALGRLYTCTASVDVHVP